MYSSQPIRLFLSSMDKEVDWLTGGSRPDSLRALNQLTVILFTPPLYVIASSLFVYIYY